MEEEWVVPPDPEVAACVDEVMAGFAGLDDEALVRALEGWAARRRQAEAMLAVVTVAVHERVTGQGHLESGATQTVAAITGTSTRSAARAVDAAYAVVEVPAVWRALAEGRIDTARARIIVDGFSDVPAPHRDDLIGRALDYAQSHTAYQVRRRVVRLLVDYDPALGPEHTARERAKAWDRRELRVHPCAHGMAELIGYLPAGTARILMAALDRIAATYSDDRTRDQKRVDALAEILASNTRLDITVDVVIPADTLAGLQDGGASVDGYGPVDGDDARALALHTDARWRRLVTDPVTGHLAAMSSRAYRIPAAMKAAVRARDRVCRFPGCATAATSSDTDHLVPWPAGSTGPGNLAPECRGHHRVKTHSGWHCHCGPDGSITWTSPLGTRHTTYPWDYNTPDW